MKSLLLILICFCFVFSDAMPFWGNRIAGEVTTSSIKLSKEQKSLLKDLDEKGSIRIALTPKQTSFLQKSAHYEMKELIVLPVSAAKGECTCESMDIGIQYDEDHVEIPHFLMKPNRMYMFLDQGASVSSELYAEPAIPNKYYQDGLSRYQRVALIAMLLLAAFTVLIVRRKMK